MTNLTQVSQYFLTVWDDFIIKDTHAYTMELDILDLSVTDNMINAAISFEKYNAYDLSGYGKGTITRGVTEQEAYDAWLQVLQIKQREFRRQLSKLQISTMPQSVFDGLFLYYFSTDLLLTVHAPEGIYDLRNAIEEKSWDTVASMIMRSNKQKQKSIRAATILRLADYGKLKNRTRLRTEGIYKIRTDNELGKLKGENLTRARFAYYAETKQFLPNIPDGLKREIAKKYEETVLYKQYTFYGDNTFGLLSSPSMDPVEKVEVKVNGDKIQHFYDFTISGPGLTITSNLVQNDIIDVKIFI